MDPSNTTAMLIAAIVALVGAIAYLFKHYQSKISDLEKERRVESAEVALERKGFIHERAQHEDVQEKFESQLRAEYEVKHRLLLENQVKMMAQMHDAAREHEANARRDFALNMEMVADKAAEASNKIAAVLDKFYDRYVSPRRGKG